MSKTILITDDDTFLTAMYTQQLEKQGWKVEVAGDGEQSIQMMDRHQPDLMVLDLLMPKRDGFSVLKHVRQKQYTFPVLILTNVRQPLDRERCLKLGATDFLTKSDTDVTELMKKIRKHLK